MTLPISAKPSLVYYCLDATPFIGALKNLYDLFFLYIHKAPSLVPPQSYQAHVLQKGALGCLLFATVSTGMGYGLVLLCKKKGIESQKVTPPSSLNFSPMNAEEYYRMGMVAEKQSQFLQAEKNYLKAVELKYSEAAYVLGVLYETGDLGKVDGNKNIIKALEFYTLAVDLGHLEACACVADICLTKDVKKAQTYARKGAEKGNVSSMTKLGQILLYSHEKKDKVEGYQWLQQAATDPIEPSGEAMVRIARLLDQDETKAKAWAQKARETIKDEKDRFYKKAGKILGILV